MQNKQILAIATCRVSTTEQELNNSLNRQREAVLRSATELGVLVPENYWFSGSVSSKRGTNVNRKDLQAMVELCKKDKRIKYVIVDEPDRFMRSIDEAAYFEVTFRQLGVTVWYASDPELNKGDLSAKLLKFTKYLSAEGSNEERQRKSISGQTQALKEGRYPFSPKPGYKRGYERAIQEIHPIRGPILRETLIAIVTRRVTPTQALIDFNKTDFMKGHSEYKMDKFRKIVTDSFYAGVVEINRQVKVYNEEGRHEPLITLEQHKLLVKIMNGKEKNQAGPRKNGNPKYPLNNLVSCDLCADKTNGRVVGYDHGNGKSKVLVYEKYRCRGCGRYLSRKELHKKVEQQFKNNPVTEEGWNDLIEALNIVWKQREGEADRQATRLRHKIKSLNEAIGQQVEAATDPSNAFIKLEIVAAIAKKKGDISELEDQLEGLKGEADSDKERFLKFAFGFVDNMGSHFLEISQENRLRCKQIIFPAGFGWDMDSEVYTPEISPLITLAGNKKDLSIDEKSLLVRVRGL
jgi:DNA invertase Pin-like site-specific DNA recombinase